jgi:dATP pyrophosphohydrolase
MSLVVSRIVEVCVFRFVNDHAEYLLLKRSPDENVYPDLWQFVTGSMRNEERAVDAALRELKEETALVPLHFWVAPHVISFYDPSRDAVNVCPFFAVQVGVGKEPVLSSEHTAHTWLSYAEARRRLVWPGQRGGLDVVEKYIVGGEQAGVLTEVAV